MVYFSPSRDDFIIFERALSRVCVPVLAAQLLIAYEVVAKQTGFVYHGCRATLCGGQYRTPTQDSVDRGQNLENSVPVIYTAPNYSKRSPQGALYC